MPPIFEVAVWIAIAGGIGSAGGVLLVLVGWWLVARISAWFKV